MYIICDNQFIEEEEHHITDVLRKNDYPTHFINHVKNNFDHTNTRTQPSSINNPPPKYIYINTVFENRLRNYCSSSQNPSMSKLHTNLLSHFEIQSATTKTKETPNQQSGVVYKLPCNDCSSVYIGETGRVLQDRLDEHSRDIRNKKELSHVYSHVDSTGHSFNFSNVKIIAKSSEP